MSPDVSETATTRATLVNAPGRYRPDIERWAIVVGISDYQHKELNLKWAHRDAEEVHKLLLSPAGGSFAADHVQLLVNEAATTQAISRALRSFLQKPAEEDVVLIYFACHGGPDPGRTSNLYLWTYDTDPNDIAGSALPMREIDLSLRENLVAERVVILADTCHSGGLGGGIGRRSVTADAGVVNAYLEAMSAARGGLALLTSATANETSQEDARWGDGHGVFTHYLLEGLRGAADGFSQPRDGKVAVGELFEYVRHQVQQATGNSQHPTIGSNPFDWDLPLAITGGINAQEHLELGQCLFELARIADEPDRYRSAARQFEEALRLASLGGIALPEASWRLAQAWLAAGDAARAMDVLDRLRERQGDALPPSALFMLGLAQAAEGNSEGAIASLHQYLERCPGNDYASWSRYCLAVLQQPIVPRALLIGIGKHAPGEYERLKFDGPANDVALIKRLLITDYGFPEDGVTVLLDEQATWQAIEQALQDLAKHAQSNDPVVVYYSGIGFYPTGPAGADAKGDGAAPEQLMLVTYDGLKATTRQLDERLRAIPSAEKILIVDGAPRSQQVIELAEQAYDYALLIAAQPGQLPKETRFMDETSQTVATHGVFTFALALAARELDKSTATLSVLFDKVRDFTQQRVNEQTPVLAGRHDQAVFGPPSPQERYSQLTVPEQWAVRTETLDELSQAYDRFMAVEIGPYAQAHLGFGRAFLAHDALGQAIAALATAVSQEENGQSLLTLGKAQVAARQYAAARDTFRRLLAQPSPASLHAKKLIEQADELTNLQRHALVVGIDRYLSPDITPLSGAANDARAMREALMQRLGFRPENIIVLLDEEASRERVVSEFRNLAQKAVSEPSLFYFAGYMSDEMEEQTPQKTFLTLVCADSRTDQILDLRLEELAVSATASHQLVTIADFSSNRELPERTIAPRPNLRGMGVLRDQHPPEDWIGLGQVSIYGDLSRVMYKGQQDGVLTDGLVNALKDMRPHSFTYREWVAAAQKVGHLEPAPILLGSGDDFVFDPSALCKAVLETATRIELDAIYRAIELLKRQIGERGRQGAIHPEGWLNLGVAYGVVGAYEQALAALEAAAATMTSTKMEMSQAAAHDVTPEEIAPEISYHLGRLLLAAQTDYGRAVSELRKATRQDTGNARAWYYLGQAIRERIRRETLAEVESAFSAYLAAGAPVGHRSEIVGFLHERASSKTETPTR